MRRLLFFFLIACHAIDAEGVTIVSVVSTMLERMLTDRADRPFPSSLREAKELWESSEFVNSAFGEAVQKHYSNYARYEQQEFDQVVTDYERRRMFERG